MSEISDDNHGDFNMSDWKKDMNQAGVGRICFDSTGKIESIDENALRILELQLDTSSIKNKNSRDFQYLGTIYQNVASFFSKNTEITRFQDSILRAPGKDNLIFIEASRRSVEKNLSKFDILIYEIPQQVIIKAWEPGYLATETLLNTTEDFSLLVDLNGKIKAINSSAMEYFQLSREEALNSNIYDFFSEKLAKERRKISQWIVKNEKPYFYEESENDIHYLNQVYPVRQSGGAIDHLAIFVHNITALKKAQEEADRAKNFLKQITDNMLDMVSVTDSKGMVKYITPSHTKILGYKDEDFIDASVLKYVHPDDREQTFAAFAECTNNKRPVRVDVRLKNIADDYVWLESVGAPVTDMQGNVESVIIASRDITARKEAEEAAKKSEENLKLTLEATTDGIWDWNVKLNVAHFSPNYYRMLGYEPNEFEATLDSWIESLHPDDKKMAVNRLESFLNSGEEIYTSQFRLKTKTGEWKWIDARAKVVERDSAVKAARIIGNHTDITKNKKIEEEHRRFELQLQQAQKMDSLGVLAGGIAHDFNNLLQSISGNTSLALMESPEGSELKNLLREIRESARYATELTRQLLAYSGKGRYIAQIINLSEIIIEMDHLLKVGISKKINLRLIMDYQLPFISADETQIKQVIMNLVLNANEASKDRGGEIIIETGKIYCDKEYLANTYLNDDLPAGEYVFVEISDQGIGVDKETINRMFDPFFSTKFIGRGLGLATVLGIVRAHNGAIEVDSELHVGSRFRVLFPAVEKIERNIEKTQQVDTKSYEGWVILFVDDEELVRNVANKMLKRKGFEVINAEDGPEAIELYKKYRDKIDLVLIDYAMPGMNGLETFYEIKKMNDAVKVIIVSGYDEGDEVKKLEDSNIIGFIQKPFRVSELLEKIRDLKF